MHIFYIVLCCFYNLPRCLGYFKCSTVNCLVVEISYTNKLALPSYIALPPHDPHLTALEQEKMDFPGTLIQNLFLHYVNNNQKSNESFKITA